MYDTCALYTLSHAIVGLHWDIKILPVVVLNACERTELKRFVGVDIIFERYNSSVVNAQCIPYFCWYNSKILCYTNLTSAMVSGLTSL